MIELFYGTSMMFLLFVAAGSKHEIRHKISVQRTIILSNAVKIILGYGGTSVWLTNMKVL